MPRTFLPSGRKLLLLLALAVLVGGLWWWTQPPPEPFAQGMKLSELVFDPKLSRSGWFSIKDQLPAFGPAGVTWLAYHAEHGRREFERDGSRPLDGAPDWLRRWFPARWGGLRPSPTVDEQINAIQALEMLGPEAAPTIPVLTRIIRQGEARLIMYAAAALTAIGPASWPATLDILEHGNGHARTAIIRTLQMRLNFPPLMKRAPDEVSRVAEVLRRFSSDPDAAVRCEVADALMEIHEDGRPLFDLAIPTLVHLLSDPEVTVRSEAARALIIFRDHAGPAIPRLIELLDEPSALVRRQAVQTLGWVDKSEKRSAVRLRRMLHDPDPYCRENAMTALEALNHLSGAESADGEVGKNGGAAVAPQAR